MENLYLYQNRNRNRTAAMQLMTLILKWSSCDYFASHYRFAMSFDFIWLQLPVHSSRLVSFRFRFVFNLFVYTIFYCSAELLSLLLLVLSPLLERVSVRSVVESFKVKVKVFLPYVANYVSPSRSGCRPIPPRPMVRSPSHCRHRRVFTPILLFVRFV